MIRFAAVILFAATLLGCQSPKKIQGPIGDLPDAKTVLENQHRAVSGLERLWATCTVRVEGKDAQGNTLKEQAEGVLQVIASNRLALVLQKLGSTKLYLGSNDEMYWWFDLLDDANRYAIFGRHAMVTPEKTAEMGLPVHPLDLVELLAITPLPENIEVVGFAANGGVIVQHPVRREGGQGTRRVTYETKDWKPVRVELVDANGETLASADLLGHTRTQIEGDATRAPWAANRIEIGAKGFDGMIRIALFGHQNKRIREAPFDFESLAERVYKIKRFYDLDNQPKPVNQEQNEGLGGEDPIEDPIEEAAP